jgi:chromate transport protein ChrA
LQYAFIFLGMLASCFMLRKYYDGIKMFDYFKHCLRTLATAVVIIVIGNFIIYLLMRSNEEPWSNLTIVIGSILFATTLSGMFSSLIASFIFYTFTKKK